MMQTKTIAMIVLIAIAVGAIGIGIGTATQSVHGQLSCFKGGFDHDDAIGMCTMCL
jgi:hypothetical protein